LGFRIRSSEFNPKSAIQSLKSLSKLGHGEKLED
jgi:hypothetical protein